MKYKILFADGLEDEGKKILEDHRDHFDFEIYNGLTHGSLMEKVKDVDALGVRSSTRVTREVFEGAPQLRLIGRAGNGLDNIDLDAASEHGVLVLNSPDEGAPTTAEHTIGLILAAARQIPSANESLKEGRWDRKSFIGTELYGKTAGILGLGRIGTLVAKRLQAFEMNVIACDPYIPPSHAEKINVRLLPFRSFLKECDILTIHVPYSVSTHHLIDQEALDQMKDEAILINCARGGIVAEKDLLDVLQAGRLRAFATDVFETEPPPSTHPFLFHPRVVATPHLGARTREAQMKVSIAIVQKMIHFFTKDEISRQSEFGMKIQSKRAHT